MPTSRQPAPAAKQKPNARPTLHSNEEFVAWVRGRCAATSYKEVAEAAGMSPAYLSHLLHGRSSIGHDLAARFGYELERVVTVTFTPIEGAR